MKTKGHVNCVKLQKRLLASNGDMDEAVIEHVANCAECRSFLAVAEIMNNGVSSEELEPPPELDAFVMNSAAAFAAMTARQKHTPSPRPTLRFASALAAAAALVIVAAWTWSLMFREKASHDRQTDLSAQHEVDSYTEEMAMFDAVFDEMIVLAEQRNYDNMLDLESELELFLQ